MKTQTRRILFPLAGAVLGMLAGAGFGMDKGIAAGAAFFGFGTILTLLTVRGGGLYPHYLIVVVPLMMLFVTLAVAFGDGGTLKRRGRGLLAALCLCNALTTGLLYAYLDERGNIFGEFGPSWAWQQEQEPPPVIRPTR